MIIRAGSRSANAEVAKQWMAGGNHRCRIIEDQWCWVGRISHSDLVAGAATEDVALRTYLDATDPMPEDVRAGEFYFDIVEAFAGGGVGSCAFTMGNSAGNNAFITSTSVFTGATLGFADTAAATSFSRRVYTGSTLVPNVRFTVDTTTAALTAGKLDIYIPFTYLPHGRS